MFNAREYIDDMVATGIPHDEAVAMAREEAAMRQRVLGAANAKHRARVDSGEEVPPMIFRTARKKA